MANRDTLSFCVHTYTRLVIETPAMGISSGALLPRTPRERRVHHAVVDVAVQAGIGRQA